LKKSKELAMGMRSNKTSRIVGYIAFIVITLICSGAHAFIVEKTNSGKEIKWFNLNVPYNINDIGGPYGSPSAIKASRQTWTNVSASALTFSYSGTTSSTAWGVNDGKNIVCFGTISESGVLAQNILWYNPSTGQTLDSDIKFNTNFPWGTDGSLNSYDVQNVGTHELGHAVGLADLYGAADSEKTMYGYSDKGETKQRTLDQDDINGIIFLYGNNNSSTSTTTTTSTPSSIKTTSIPVTTIRVTTTTSIAPVRVIDFTASPVSGSAPLTVTFNNLSKGDITYRYWDFGDGSSISFDSSPVHHYRKPGAFNVTLVAGFADGSQQRMVKQNYISVESRCLFVSALENQEHVNKIRQLRTALKDNRYWRELSVMYYRNFFEVMLILRQCPELRDELQRLVSTQIDGIEKLSTVGEMTISADEIEEIIAFLLQIREHGSIRLQKDIDSVMAGINHTLLLEELGVYKK
jgi:PKD repeat protein